MIILEGADCVGKTTFAKLLCDLMVEELHGTKTLGERRGVTADSLYKHMSRPPDDFDHVAGYLTRTGAHVQDRFHLGSMVYGMMLGRGTYPNPHQMRIVQRALRWQGAIVVILHGERDWHRQELQKQVGPEMYDEATILNANEGFRALVDGHNRGEDWADFAIDCSEAWPSEENARTLIKDWRTRWLK